MHFDKDAAHLLTSTDLHTEMLCVAACILYNHNHFDIASGVHVLSS